MAAYEQPGCGSVTDGVYDRRAGAVIAPSSAFEQTPRMEPSEEICRVVHRWLVANRDGDVDAVMARISEHEGLLAIGTDPGEWWHVAERAVWRRQMEESGGFPLDWGEIEAWEEGTVGWAGMTMTIGAPDGDGASSELRGTYVLHLEHGEWKIVQVHWSLPGSANVDLLGMELTVSLEQRLPLPLGHAHRVPAVDP